jgi:hypothetical protein
LKPVHGLPTTAAATAAATATTAAVLPFTLVPTINVALAIDFVLTDLAGLGAGAWIRPRWERRGARVCPGGGDTATAYAGEGVCLLHPQAQVALCVVALRAEEKKLEGAKLCRLRSAGGGAWPSTVGKAALSARHKGWGWGLTSHKGTHTHAHTSKKLAMQHTHVYKVHAAYTHTDSHANTSACINTSAHKPACSDGGGPGRPARTPTRASCPGRR